MQRFRISRKGFFIVEFNVSGMKKGDDWKVLIERIRRMDQNKKIAVLSLIVTTIGVIIAFFSWANWSLPTSKNEIPSDEKVINWLNQINKDYIRTVNQNSEFANIDDYLQSGSKFRKDLIEEIGERQKKGEVIELSDIKIENKRVNNIDNLEIEATQYYNISAKNSKGDRSEAITNKYTIKNGPNYKYGFIIIKRIKLKF